MAEPWVERYRPKTLAECILSEANAEQAKAFVRAGTIPNLIFSGMPGSGKTTLAKALANELNYDVLFIKGSDEGRFLDTFRNKIRKFASTVSFDAEHKMVIVDEADGLPQDTVQPALRSFIEEFSSNCCFVFTCNHPNKILGPIRSRFSEIVFDFPKNERDQMAKQMAMRCAKILKENDVTFDPKVLVELVKRHFPDLRRTLNELQRYASHGSIDTGILSTDSSNAINDLIGRLRKKSFPELRAWVAANPDYTVAQLTNLLYSKADEYSARESFPDLVAILAKYEYQDHFVANKEINIMAMLSDVLVTCDIKKE